MSEHNAVGRPGARDPEPHGQAALLLVESLIHGLAARSLLTVNEVIEIVQDACDTQIAIAAEGPAAVGHRQAATLLTSILESLRIDAVDEDA